LIILFQVLKETFLICQMLVLVKSTVQFWLGLWCHLFVWDELIEWFLLPPRSPNHAAFIEVWFFSYLKPPPILEYRSNKQEIVSNSYKYSKITTLKHLRWLFNSWRLRYWQVENCNNFTLSLFQIFIFKRFLH